MRAKELRSRGGGEGNETSIIVCLILVLPNEVVASWEEGVGKVRGRNGVRVERESVDYIVRAGIPSASLYVPQPSRCTLLPRRKFLGVEVDASSTASSSSPESPTVIPNPSSNSRIISVASFHSPK